MCISEGSTHATFMLADTTVIPAVPTINAEPEYIVQVAVNEEFISKFIKAKNGVYPPCHFFKIMDPQLINNGKTSQTLPMDVKPMCAYARK